MANNNDKKVLNVPALRFPELTGEWENITIREACSEFQSISPFLFVYSRDFF